MPFRVSRDERGPGLAGHPVFSAVGSTVGSRFRVSSWRSWVESPLFFYVKLDSERVIITLVHMKEMRNKGIVRDVGHLDNAIDLACQGGLEGVKVDCTKTQRIFSSSSLVALRSCWLHATGTTSTAN